MKNTALVLLCGLAGIPGAVSQQQEVPALDGYVTRVASNSDFDLNGLRVYCNGVEYLPPGAVRSVTPPPISCPAQAPFLGEHIAVYGAEDLQSDAVYAVRIELLPRHQYDIFGSAVIDAVPAQAPPAASPHELLVRADGYRIRIMSKTRIEWSSPLQSLADVKAGDWIRYKGRPDASGVLIAESVRIGPNAIGDEEERLRAKDEYDPSSVPADAKQNLLKDAFSMGYDPKKFPPFNDAAMQDRIEKIGNSLVPAYQRALPDSDPARIHFRFQLVENKHFCGWMPCDAIALPSGVILVPHQVVERIQNDSQLAAILANGIARALEKQDYRTQTRRKVAIAAGVAGAFVPVVGPSIIGEGMTIQESIFIKEQKQGDRVSLDLLHDAGYDVDQAPIAWWLLASMKPKPVTQIDMPDRAGYLYRILGEFWHNPALNPPRTN